MFKIIRGQLDLLHGAELYRRYKVYDEKLDKREDEYILDREERLNNIIDYFSDDKLIIKDINDLSDYYTYKFGINNYIKNNNLIFGCASLDTEMIELLAERVYELAFEVEGYFEEVNYDIDYQEKKIYVNVE